MQVCTDLYSVATTDSLPSEETVSILTEVLYELPDLGDKLLRAVGLVRLRFDIHIACLYRCLDELSDSDATRNIGSSERSDAGQLVAAAQFYRLLALFDVPEKEAYDKGTELYQLLVRIVNLTIGTSLLSRTTVLSCLLAQKSWLMCRCFVKLLDRANLCRLVCRNLPPQISSVYSHSIAPSSTVPISFFHDEQTLCKAMSEHELITDTSYMQSTIDTTGIMTNVLSSITDDAIRIVAILLSASHHAVWYHLYLMCLERRIHFFDLFLVCNMCLWLLYFLDTLLILFIIYKRHMITGCFLCQNQD